MLKKQTRRISSASFVSAVILQKFSGVSKTVYSAEPKSLSASVGVGVGWGLGGQELEGNAPSNPKAKLKTTRVTNQ
jgi:hypothetical protein